MLEKLAEMVREDAFDCGSSMPCFACNRNDDCNLVESQNRCPDLEKPDGSLMLARWAVLLVARGLGVNVEELYSILAVKKDDAQTAGYRFLDLVVEAKEGTCTKE